MSLQYYMVLWLHTYIYIYIYTHTIIGRCILPLAINRDVLFVLSFYLIKIIVA